MKEQSSHIRTHAPILPHVDLNKQYKDVRGSVAIAKRDLLKIDASTSTQVCKRFGIHPKLPLLQELYNDGDALFFAGIGVLSKPVTKQDYMRETATVLFAHNACKYCFSLTDLRRIASLLTFLPPSLTTSSTSRNWTIGPVQNLNRNRDSWPSIRRAPVKGFPRKCLCSRYILGCARRRTIERRKRCSSQFGRLPVVQPISPQRYRHFIDPATKWKRWRRQWTVFKDLVILTCK